MLHKSLNLITFVKSDEAEASSAGEQLVRNNLINENNDEVGENLTSDLIIIFVSYPLKNSINFYSLFHFPLKQYKITSPLFLAIRKSNFLLNNQYRQFRKGMYLPNFLTNFKPSHLWHHNIKNNKVVAFASLD